MTLLWERCWRSLSARETTGSPVNLAINLKTTLFGTRLLIPIPPRSLRLCGASFRLLLVGGARPTVAPIGCHRIVRGIREAIAEIYKSFDLHRLDFRGLGNIENSGTQFNR